eukprot:CAMPEP_0181539334 /NCGR_PEP_ID=MMETSP1110-20121109/76321_1 /TAXON_ID=174948 /ORGANISM="Symbiodinium sp., Strain CCMP421" /LENGTH=30 /DNA_ID= /DNA_START= /DNA_END= /DNA_ORIENTATION=
MGDPRTGALGGEGALELGAVANDLGGEPGE